MKKVAVLFNETDGFFATNELRVTDEDTAYLARTVSDSLNRSGYAASPVSLPADKIAAIGKIDADVFFNICEWSGKQYPLTLGVLKRLERSGLVYTGCDFKMTNSYITKADIKRTAKRLGIRTPDGFVAMRPAGNLKTKAAKLVYPLIVKPVLEHGSVGIHEDSVIESSRDLPGRIKKFFDTYEQPILVEEYIDGAEVNIMALKTKDTIIFPPTEIIFATKAGYRKFFSFESKWGETGSAGSVFEATRPFYGSRKLLSELNEIVRKIMKDSRCGSYVRLDFRIRKNVPFLLEVNTNPSLNPDMESPLMVACAAMGWSYDTLVARVLESAGTQSNYLSLASGL